MNTGIRKIITDALAEICRAACEGELPPIIIEKPRRDGQGDLATNVALLLARKWGLPPREAAERIVGALRSRKGFLGEVCERLEIAGPGFINFFLSPKALHGQLLLVLRGGEGYGGGRREIPVRVQIEFVSANPTGPLTIAHGRQAAVGDSLARILRRAGYEVISEYYLNDKGRQIRLLGLSAWLRYRELWGEKVAIPEGGYRGAYLIAISEKVKARDGEKWLSVGEEEAVSFFEAEAVNEIMGTIRGDLDEFRVRFDHWTGEREFSETGKIEACLGELERRGCIYEKDGAVWFRSTAFGDDKDRVLVKSNGDRTYFTPDIAYHRDKLERGFDRVIDLWGPDHHGYISRMKAAVTALGFDERCFTPLIVQLTTLFRGDRKLSMSTRAGEFVTVRQLIDEVGVDAARYYFERMKVDSHLNFDMELAKARSNNNPVYYVQYVHARICSIFKRLADKKPGFRLPPWDEAPLEMLEEDEERKIISLLADFPLVIERAAEALEPGRICNYLEGLAASFHQCYTRHTVISDDDGLTAARLALAEGVRTVVRNGLGLLGVSAPEQM